MQNFDLLAAPKGQIDELVSSLSNSDSTEKAGESGNSPLLFSDFMTDIENQSDETLIKTDHLTLDDAELDLPVTPAFDETETSIITDIKITPEQLESAPGDIQPIDIINIYPSGSEINTIAPDMAEQSPEQAEQVINTLGTQQALSESPVKTAELDSEFSKKESKVSNLVITSNDPVNKTQTTFATMATQTAAHVSPPSQNAITQSLHPHMENGEIMPEGGKILPLSTSDTKLPLSGIDSNLLLQESPKPGQAGAQVFAVADIDTQTPATKISTSPNSPLPALQSTMQAGSRPWLEEFSGQIRFLGHFDIKHAQINLHPAELGAIEIKISSIDDMATVNFTTSNTAAREIIENSLPRLRDMLASFGLNLTDSSVSQQKQGEGNEAGTGQDLKHNNTELHTSSEEPQTLLTEVTINANQDAGRINIYV